MSGTKEAPVTRTIAVNKQGKEEHNLYFIKELLDNTEKTVKSSMEHFLLLVSGH